MAASDESKAAALLGDWASKPKILHTGPDLGWPSQSKTNTFPYPVVGSIDPESMYFDEKDGILIAAGDVFLRARTGRKDTLFRSAQLREWVRRLRREWPREKSLLPLPARAVIRTRGNYNRKSTFQTFVDSFCQPVARSSHREIYRISAMPTTFSCFKCFSLCCEMHAHPDPKFSFEMNVSTIFCPSRLCFKAAITSFLAIWEKTKIFWASSAFCARMCCRSPHTGKCFVNLLRGSQATAMYTMFEVDSDTCTQYVE